jgi:TetR/AcrR family transcriptional regulator
VPRDTADSSTRQQILEAALTAFSERGFDGASLRDIADTVGVRHGLIRSHFGTKEMLWRAVVAWLYERQLKALLPSAVESQLPARARFELFIRRYVAYSARHPEHGRLLMQESTHDNPRIAHAAKTYIAPAHALLRPNLETLIGNGELPDIPLEMLIYAMTGLGQLPFLLLPEIRHTYGADFRETNLVNRYADAVLALLLRPAGDGQDRPDREGEAPPAD